MESEMDKRVKMAIGRFLRIEGRLDGTIMLQPELAAEMQRRGLVELGEPNLDKLYPATLTEAGRKVV